MSTFGDWAYKPGGDHYFSGSMDLINKLPPEWRTAAMEVAAVMWALAREGNFCPTSAEIAARLPTKDRDEDGERTKDGHRCISFVQKGLYALHRILGVIDRVRKGGRRWLTLPKGLKPARGPKSARDAGSESAAGPPPGPPPEERNYTTTTGTPSSSKEFSPEKTEGPGEPPPPGLVDRAIKLIPGLTPGIVAYLVVKYTAEWVEQGLDDAEEHNRKCQAKGKRPVQGVGFLLDRLKRWDNEGGPPARVPKPIAEAPTSSVKASAKADEAAAKAQLQRLREKWGLLPEAERESIGDVVRREQPHTVRFASMFEAACLGEMERRQAAEVPRAP